VFLDLFSLYVTQHYHLYLMWDFQFILWFLIVSLLSVSWIFSWVSTTTDPQVWIGFYHRFLPQQYHNRRSCLCLSLTPSYPLDLIPLLGFVRKIDQGDSPLLTYMSCPYKRPDITFNTKPQDLVFMSLFYLYVTQHSHFYSIWDFELIIRFLTTRIHNCSSGCFV